MAQEIFLEACENGELLSAKELLALHPTIDISGNKNHAFRMACKNNHLPVVKWLAPLITMDVSYYEKSFRIACQDGHLAIAKFLLLSKPTLDIYSNNNNAIRLAFQNNHIRVSDWLESLSPNYSIILENIIVENYRRLDHVINNSLPMHSEIIYIECSDEDKECTICTTNNINLQTNCKHNFCTECISEWYDLHKTCQYCRADITQFKNLVIT